MLVFGRDRPDNLSSGFGGSGATQSGRVDIIAGLASSEGALNSEEMRNPSFQSDAARIYISQKASIDKYMGLAAVPNESSEGRSAIGIKADAIRFHSRGDLKLVTGRQKISNGGSNGEKLSTGGINEVPGKIYFLAGNYTTEERSAMMMPLDFSGPPVLNTNSKIQPVPRGDNLSELLTEMIDISSEITQEVQDILMILMELNFGLAGHIHAPAPIVVTGPSPTLAPQVLSINGRLGTKMANIALLQQRFELLKQNYLESTGAAYINSNHVFTT